jgi:hypothetical protein
MRRARAKKIHLQPSPGCAAASVLTSVTGRVASSMAKKQKQPGEELPCTRKVEYKNESISDNVYLRN